MEYIFLVCNFLWIKTISISFWDIEANQKWYFTLLPISTNFILPVLIVRITALCWKMNVRRNGHQLLRLLQIAWNVKQKIHLMELMLVYCSGNFISYTQLKINELFLVTFTAKKFLEVHIIDKNQRRIFQIN